MRAVLIPVKELSNAKQRLAPHFSIEERIALADALWQDFLEVMAGVRGIDRVFVVSSEARVLERAKQIGWEAIPECRQISESDSVDFASLWCAERGVDALLRLPVDLPLVEPRDIEDIFEQMPPAPGALLVPSQDGDGTNALLRTPPALFPSHFGRGSFQRHLAEASRCGAQVRIVRNPRLELDVDELDDLSVLSARRLRPTRTRVWLLAHGYDGVAQKAAGVGVLSRNPS
ncbi:MAG: 2-phospho-L-lactate guanylyltransferase [Candidatus Acidiferrales bacterium]